MKKRNIITIILLIYLGIMAYIGWPNYIDEGRYWEYAGRYFSCYFCTPVRTRQKRKNAQLL